MSKTTLSEFVPSDTENKQGHMDVKALVPHLYFYYEWAAESQDCGQ